MTEQALIRLTMALQNQAPTTIDKYICKLAETILFDAPTGMDIADLSKAINEQFNLSFTYDEMEKAIKRKSGKRIVIINGKHCLGSQARDALSAQKTISNLLDKFVADFIIFAKINNPANQISELIMKYLYFCFNSNVDNLLTLLSRKPISENQVFEATNDEIEIINTFITWDNSEKNGFLYRVIATCYEYCMLTVKKDNIVSQELFKGKKFYLDANIIFRMAGINNEERQYVTHDFVRHCNDASIELYCTSSTIDEIYRVISSQIDMVRGIANLSMPVSCEALKELNPSYEINDIYRLYYEWCNVPGNICGDYTSFQKYMLDLIQSALKKLKIKQSTSYKIKGINKNFNEHAQSLCEYKSKRRKRTISFTSAETDVTNIFDIIEWRQKSGTTIWQTNDFIVSADHLLIGWASTVYPGVPIVLLPSVWLSIILRFTGRSDDDYKSFCLFLTQRQHISPSDAIDPILLLKNINTKTTNKELKEKIIIEICQNKSEYIFNADEDYDSNVNQAFDKVLEEFRAKTDSEINEIKLNMDAQFKELSRSSEMAAAERAKFEAQSEKEKTLLLLSKNQASDKVKAFKALGNKNWIFYLIGAIVIIGGVMTWMYEIQPIYSWVLGILPQKLTADSDAFINAWTIISLGIGLLIAALGKLFSSLCSTEREQKLYEKYLKRNRKILELES